MGNSDNGDNPLGDTVWMIMAMLGLVLIIIVYMRNKDINGDWINKTFMVDSYYALPKSDKDIDERSLYMSLTGSAMNRSCKQTFLTQSGNGKLRLSGVSGSKPHDVWIMNLLSLTGNSSDATTITTGNKLYEYLHIKSIVDKAEEVSLWSEVSKSTGNEMDNVEIIAPFNFTFYNSNTDNSDSIVIVSADGRLRLTFGGVSNWFCAGSPDLDYNTVSGDTYIDSIEYWKSHGINSGDYSNPHYTVVGNSANSKVKNGTAGTVIGYANIETTLLIEYMEGSTWKKISLKEWLN